MIQRLTRQAAEFAGIAGPSATDKDLIAQALKSSGGGTEEAILPQLPGDLRPIEGESGMSTFSGREQAEETAFQAHTQESMEVDAFASAAGSGRVKRKRGRGC
jgi:hypothetical protein